MDSEFTFRRMRKWNYQKQEYDAYVVPENWNCSVLEGLDKDINCAACGKVDKFGVMYCSFEIHNPVGFGYAVCAECHDKEMMRQIEYIRKN